MHITHCDDLHAFVYRAPIRATQGVSQAPSPVDWKLLEVKVIARGSSATSSMGNMDTYLAIVSRKGKPDQSAARLVHYYPSFETGLRSEWMLSGRTFHLRLSSASYCSMQVKDFIAERIFNQDAVSKLDETRDQDFLPCFILRK
jgi:hypothetical protein